MCSLFDCHHNKQIDLKCFLTIPHMGVWTNIDTQERGFILTTWTQEKAKSGKWNTTKRICFLKHGVELKYKGGRDIFNTHTKWKPCVLAFSCSPFLLYGIHIGITEINSKHPLPHLLHVRELFPFMLTYILFLFSNAILLFSLS